MLKQIKKLIIAIIGFSILLVGLAMIILPGPAVVVIPLALVILASEFYWAKVILEKTKDKFRRGYSKTK